MTIIVFLIDTSASMLQRTYIGGRTTLLDVAKSAVETFVKIRQRSMDSRIDRYMLLTFEETPSNIKAGWKENLATFMNELKNLQCYSMTTMGVAVKQAFDILNINRMTSGIDTYGQGRCPFFLETSVIVLITDGGKLTTVNGVHEEFNLPMHSPVPGSEMTREPFRWDQRLFALVLRLTGTPAIERDTGLVPNDSSPIDAMCEVTGGRSYSITSHRMLNQCIDSLVQKVQNGVVINFEKIGPDPPPPQFEKGDDGKDEVKEPEFDDRLVNQPILSTSWHNCRKMIYVPKSSKSYCVGFWPIPESFWPEVTASVLPARSAHPNIKFTCTSSEPLVIENLPFDKYELEPSPLTQFILSRKQPKTCWQVFVANSYKNSEVGHPFGYLKASTNLNCVNLFVMPYNYPVLLPLLDELSKVHRWKPTNEWRTQFQNYLRTMPAYYAGPLRRALTRMGTPLALAQTLIPENSENLSYSVSNYLKRLKNQAKSEYDKLCSEITLRQNTNNLKSNSEQVRVLPKVTLKKDLISHPLLADKFTAQRDQLIDQSNSFIVTLDKERQNVSFKNPFDIPRSRLIQQVVRMRNNFLQPDWISLDQDSAHSLPISQMGNYQEYLKRQTPQLREIESAPVRQHMFGNPFKIDKRMMVDEADLDPVASSPGANRNNKRPNPADIGGRLPLKRKPGPLPKAFSIRRPSAGGTPPPSPTPLAPSPVPWTSAIEKDLPSFDERPSLIAVNGLDNSASSSERSRSPSPTMDMPSYSVSEVNLANRNSNPFGYTNSGALDTATTNSLNDFYPSVSVSDDSKQSISQILKEANSINNSVVNHQAEVKPKVVEDMREIEVQNNEIRKQLHKLVRRPGKNFTELFDNIKTLKGNTEVQVKMVELIIKESLRFKRQHLAHLLQEYIQSLLSVENK
ncbi:hypothetical protein Zmor_009530 [Zophobas morio]|uniref:VWFA domain-containing protein n=1 Tax=Zophobas morio TaxID=2755281 RepID=A0AA38IPE0_9CUCU|nr:hypothetical protein Zmor_009530 [Zophobas morio]